MSGASPTPASIPFRLVKGFAIVIPVIVDGRGPYEFLLDTGAQTSTVDRDLAKTLDLRPEMKGTVITLTGRSPAFLTKARAIGVGPFEKENADILVRDLAGLRLLDRNIRGVIGQNVIGDADYLLDYSARVLTFDQSNALVRQLRGDRVAVTRMGATHVGSASIISIGAKIDEVPSRPVHLLMDSGTASLILFTGKRYPNSKRRADLVRDANDNVAYAEPASVQLEVGSVLLRLVGKRMTFRGAGEQIDGLLPTSVFRSLYVSNSRGFVVLAPRWTPNGDS